MLYYYTSEINVFSVMFQSCCLLSCRSLATDLRLDMQKRQQEEEGWYRQQQLLVEAEKARRNIIAEEEQKLADQRTRSVALC